MIFSFLRRLFRRHPSGYADRERLIFRFWDGARWRTADPLAAHRALMTDPNFELDNDPRIAEQPTTVGLIAQGRVAAAVRRAFGVAGVADGGLLDLECLNLFVEFGDYMKSLEEFARPLPSGPTPTDSPASAV